MNKLLKKTMGNIDLKSIEKGVEDGKYDAKKMQSMIEFFLGKEGSDNLVSQIQEKVEKGEKVSLAMIVDLVRKNINLTKLQEKVKQGDISLDQMRDTLNGLVGKDQTDKILKDANEVADELDKDDLTLEKK